jgi:peptidoglycan-associated lipoprotein
MKITLIAFVLAALTSGGCSKDKKVVKPTPEPAKPVAAKPADDKLLEKLSADTQVSPNLALAGDIVSLCGIKISANATASPTFDYDKDELHPEDRTVLDQLATCLVSGALKGRSVSLTGRADPRGTEEYNLGLGSRRAASVSSYLERLGVGQPQLGVTTRGALDASGTDEAGWAKDRRVDITLAN